MLSFVKNKKTFIFFIFLQIISISSIAQNLSNSVQNIGGISSFSNNSSSLTYSIGEMSSIQSFIGINNYILSTGFIQSFDPLVTGLSEINLIHSNEITISPNPTTGLLQIQIKFNTIGTLYFKLLDAQSRIIKQDIPIKNIREYQKLFDLERYPSGIYYLNVQFITQVGIIKQSVYKIIKV